MIYNRASYYVSNVSIPSNRRISIHIIKLVWCKIIYRHLNVLGKNDKWQKFVFQLKTPTSSESCVWKLMKNIMGYRIYLVLTHVIIWIVQVSPRCTSFDMQVHAGASLENTRVQSVKKERIFPKSCAATCSDHEGCLGASVDEETDTCIFHYGNEDGITCPSLVSTELGQKLYLKESYNSGCLSVS